MPARQMDDDAQPGTELTVRGFTGQPRGGAQGFDPGRHVDHRVRVQGTGAPVVPDVQRSQ